MFASHNQLHMIVFSDVVNLLVSAPGAALHLCITYPPPPNEPELKHNDCFQTIILH